MINKLTTLAAAIVLVSTAANANEQTVYQFLKFNQHQALNYKH